MGTARRNGATRGTAGDDERTLRFEFCSPKQRSFVADDQSPGLLYSGAFRAGKSTALALKAHRYALEYPGAFVVVARKSYASIVETTMATFRSLIPELPQGYYRFHETRHRAAYWNGSVVYFVGCDDLSRIKSLRADVILVDQAEELAEADWMTLEGRLNVHAVPRSQIAAACNPEAPTHWLWQLFQERADYRTIQTNTYDNSLLPEDYFRRVQHYRGRYRDRYLLGKWVGFEGLVWPAYDPETHVVEPFPIPPDWPRYRSVDWGFQNPFCCLWAAVDEKGQKGPEGGVYVYRELYVTRHVVEDLARWVERLTGKEPIEQTWADHDAEDRATAARYGLRTQSARKAVKEGIEAVTRYLEPLDWKGDGRTLPMLRFFKGLQAYDDERLEADRKPRSVLQELSGYSWAPPKEGRSAKEEPVKLHDHGCDTLRYLVMGIEARNRSYAATR